MTTLYYSERFLVSWVVFLPTLQSDYPPSKIINGVQMCHMWTLGVIWLSFSCHISAASCATPFLEFPLGKDTSLCEWRRTWRRNGLLDKFYSSSIDSGRLRGGAKALFCSFKFLLGTWNPVVNLCPGGPQREGGTKWICHKKFMITFPHTHVGNRYEEDLFPGQTGQDWLVAAVVGGSFQLTVYTVAWATQRRIVAYMG